MGHVHHDTTKLDTNNSHSEKAIARQVYPAESNHSNLSGDRIRAAPGIQLIQAKCGHCEVEKKAQFTPMTSFLQRKGTGSGTTASESISRQLDSVKGSGNNLDDSTRMFMESRFATGFGDVKIHTGPQPSELNRELNAKAFTVGNDIYFNEGEFQPQTSEGKFLLAHELTHTLQQNKNSPVKIQRVQLTYDDGPDSAGNTRIILDALNAAGAKATFYLVGKRIAQADNWRIVFDIAAAGHWLGNHAYDWNDAKDDHIFLHGTTEERAEKILQTEWVIRDALIQGKAEAIKKTTWNAIPQANRDYIDDVIAHGTGRFRTPGFRSHFWSSDGLTTSGAISSVNQVLSATGLRPLAITRVGTLNEEGVDVDPEDWRAGRTQAEIESSVKSDLDSNSDSILLHSRIGASAAATPAIISNIQSNKWTFDPTVQGGRGSVMPKPGFGGLSTISNPPTSTEIAAARGYLKKNMLSFGPYVSGAVALGIFQMAQQAGNTEVMNFAAEIKSTSVTTKTGIVPMANWMNAYPDWKLFTTFFENWHTQKPFPRIKGVTI